MTADIKANGSDGPVTINNGTDYSYTWTSTGATACTLTAPNGVSGISTAGAGGPISPAHPWYPAIGAPVTLTLDCTDGVNSASDLVVIDVSVTPVTVTADIKINNSDGPVVIPNGDSWTYSWSSTNATACTLTSPTGDSGVTIVGNGGPIAPGHPWYPALGSSTTLTINCTNGGSSATDSAVISVTTTPPPPPPGGCPVSLSITSEGSASVRLNNAFSYTVTSLVTGSVATTTYTMSGTLPAGLSFNASTGTISGTPTEKGTFTVTFNATNDCANASKTLTISVTTGGGGGGGGGGHHSAPEIPSLEGFCPYLTSYLRYGVANDPMQVIKLQAFLKVFEHFDYVSINGVFDEATLQAVKAFQARYASEILTPWGISEPTGYVYTLTLAKINQILCGSPMPTVHITPHATISKEGGSKEGGHGLQNSVPTVGNNVSKGQKVEKEGFWSHMAAALFSFPDSAVGFLQTLYELLLIAIVLYILGSIFESVLYKDVPENVSNRYKAKWTAIILGLVIALFGAYFAGAWTLLFPLLIGLIAVGIYLLVVARKRKQLLPVIILKEEKIEETKVEVL